MTGQIDIETESATPALRRGRQGRFAALAILAIILLGATVGGIASKAFAQGWGPGFMHGRGGPMDPADMAKFVERRVKHFCVDIDCTPEQQGKLIVIAQNLAKDIGPMRQEMRATRERVMGLLAAPTIDRTALEQLRAQRVQRIDDMSKRFTGALADAAEVLTPEQRVAAEKRFEEMRERRWFHHRG